MSGPNSRRTDVKGILNFCLGTASTVFHGRTIPGCFRKRGSNRRLEFLLWSRHRLILKLKGSTRIGA